MYRMIGSMTDQKNSLCSTWDLTLKSAGVDQKILRAWFMENCTKWTYQLESGKETEYSHFQIRVRFHDRMRKSRVINFLKGTVLEGAHVSLTSNGGTKKFNYVMKDATRIAGPWSDEDPNMGELPWQLEVSEEYPWQKAIREDILNQAKRATFEGRKINMIVSEKGCEGRSTIAGRLMFDGLALMVPPLDDFKAIIQYVASFKSHLGYCFDMPRSIGQRALKQFYAGIECLKQGYVFETRYKGAVKMMNAPAIWVFSNTYPKVKRLSIDRWNIFTIDEEWKILRKVPIEELQEIQDRADGINAAAWNIEPETELVEPEAGPIGASLRSAVTLDPLMEDD